MCQLLSFPQRVWETEPIFLAPHFSLFKIWLLQAFSGQTNGSDMHSHSLSFPLTCHSSSQREKKERREKGGRTRFFFKSYITTTLQFLAQCPKQIIYIKIMHGSLHSREFITKFIGYIFNMCWKVCSFCFRSCAPI